ncbi:apelin receptor 2 [Corythoichthys intestinalis]|uniref:apelin receptor 2 n=1 Tax=Corythoichthys intestinalis TaxID=161448 RepID=UPI0025A67101|nr:apelin receptor 2 [Corythoichthys intestinalis]XP_057693825.1 apelin receptor 2 [Corythoichthys intestinalis]XP_057693826.1 apelin receptor 2 [Corythoichthys intestinalis]XP_061812495.1 apelin receptor 2 [Nerophis lumbriciformis]
MESNTSDLDYMTSPSPPFFQCDYTDWSPSFSIIPCVYLLAFALGCLGNALVLWAYLDRVDGRRRNLKGLYRPCCWNEKECGYRTRRNTSSSSSSSATTQPCSLTDSLIASLALADLCFLVTLPLWAVYTALGYHWPFGQTLCRLSSFLTALNMYASVFSLSVLSVERYWVLTGLRRRRPPGQAPWVLAGLWLLAGVLALPGLLLRSVQEADWPDESGSVACQMDYSALIGDELDEDERERAQLWWAAVLSLKSTLAGFLLPLVILLMCYCSLARLLSRHFGRGPRPDRRRQRRLLRVIVTLVLAFFLCWLPLHVNKNLSLLLEFGYLPYSCTLDQILLAAHPYVTCVAYLNSCLNPLLYAACDPSFCKRCRQMLMLLCEARRRKEVKIILSHKEVVERRSDSPMRTQEETADKIQETDMVTEGQAV